MGLQKESAHKCVLMVKFNLFTIVYINVYSFDFIFSSTVMPTIFQNDGNHEPNPYILVLLIVLILCVVLATLAIYVLLRKYYLVKPGSKDIIKKLNNFERISFRAGCKTTYKFKIPQSMCLKGLLFLSISCDL